MSDEIKLSADGERALAEAQSFCARRDVAIVAPEHVLAGALMVLGAGGFDGVPGADALEAALLSAQGCGSEPLATNVMFGSAAREAISFTAAGVRSAGQTQITAATLAAGVIASGEVGPMFFAALNTTRDGLMATLA
jgi:hypothetical protein